MIGSAEQKNGCMLGISMKLELLGAVEYNIAGQLNTRRRKDMEQGHIAIAGRAVRAMSNGEEMAWKKVSQVYGH
jgi:hypothetical protein